MFPCLLPSRSPGARTVVSRPGGDLLRGGFSWSPAGQRGGARWAEGKSSRLPHPAICAPSFDQSRWSILAARQGLRRPQSHRGRTLPDCTVRIAMRTTNCRPRSAVARAGRLLLKDPRTSRSTSSSVRGTARQRCTLQVVPTAQHRTAPWPSSCGPYYEVRRNRPLVTHPSLSLQCWPRGKPPLQPIALPASLAYVEPETVGNPTPEPSRTHGGRPCPRCASEPWTWTWSVSVDPARAVKRFCLFLPHLFSPSARPPADASRFPAGPHCRVASLASSIRGAPLTSRRASPAFS
jgi:hypothetical protein